MEVESSENVPSPTHPPVVINSAHSDKCDDQLSKTGEEIKTPVQQPAEENHHGSRIISIRKSNADTKQDDSLNFGIKTLEEIRLKKQKDKTKQQSEGPSGAPAHQLQSQTVPVPKKENVRTLVRTVTLSAKQGEVPVIRLNIADKPGKQESSVADVSGLPLKRSLAERLGKKIKIDRAPRRENGAKPAGEIHVKTLEEIRLERANQRGETPAAPQAEGCCKVEDPSSRVRPFPAHHIKTYSEALAERKHKGLEEEKQKVEELLTEKRAEGKCKNKRIFPPPGPGNVKLEEPRRKIKRLEGIHIKTLEEIKQEKALRMQQVAKPAAGGREEKKTAEWSRAAPKAVSAPSEPWDQSTPDSRAQAKSLEGTIKEKLQLRQPEKLKKEVAAVPAAAKETVKAKGNVCEKPWDGKASSPIKRARKRKAAEISPSAVAAVNPQRSTEEEEPPAKKAKIAALTAGPALPEVSLLTKAVGEDDFEKFISEILAGELEAKCNVCEKPWDGKASSPIKRARKRKAAEISPSAVAAVNPQRSTEEEEPPAKKAKIAALTAAPALPEVSLLTKAVEEDDLEKFISEFLEEMDGQYDLELEKDVDELHLELSEMIDSISE